jgi:hypothetical protein
MTPRDRVDQLVRSAVRDDVSVIDDRNPVAESFGLIHVMRREQDGSAGGPELFDQRPELAP